MTEIYFAESVYIPEQTVVIRMKQKDLLRMVKSGTLFDVKGDIYFFSEDMQMVIIGAP